MSRRKVGHVRHHMAVTIFSARRGLKISQAKLAERAMLTPKFIGEIEREEKSPSCDTLWRIVIALRRLGARVDPASMFPEPR